MWIVVTLVTSTGTGMPVPSADRAGPGVLVRSGGLASQFDAGRATALRLAALGLSSLDLAGIEVLRSTSVRLSTPSFSWWR